MDQIHSLREILEMIYSIRVLGFWFNFSKCLNFKIHSPMNAFHLIEICWIPFLFKFCSRRVLMFPFRIKKFLFTLNFKNYFFCLFIFHISKFGKFWHVTIESSTSMMYNIKSLTYMLSQSYSYNIITSFTY